MRSQTTPSRTAPASWRWAILGSMLGGVLAVVMGAPARWLSSGVGWATQDRVQLMDARGTIWSGSAALTLTGGKGAQDRRRLPARVHWQWGLTWPGLTLHTSAECCTPEPLKWQLRLTRKGLVLQLQDQQSRWPMALLAGLGAPWNTLDAQGRLQWQSSSLQLHWREGTLYWQGQTQLQLQQVTSRLSTLRPMGSYQIIVQGTASGTPTPDLTLHTLQGPLQLQGQGQWLGQRLRFSGEASAQEGAEAALTNLLNIIGRREGSRSLLSLG